MSKRGPRASAFALGGLTAFALLLPPGCNPGSPTFHGTPYEDPAPAVDFALTDQHGEAFRLSDHRGKIVLLFFGYVHCPDVCPATLSTWVKVERRLNSLAEEVEFVFVTVDPERDTTEHLREHLAIFSPGFVGLGGTAEELEPVYEAYGIYHERVRFSRSAASYVVDHTTRMFVIDREGRLSLSFGFDSDPDLIVHDIRQLARQPGP